MSTRSVMIAVDPGNTETAFVEYFANPFSILGFGKIPNSEMRMILMNRSYFSMAIEQIACYGMPVGKEVFETAEWIGRFKECLKTGTIIPVFRKDVKMYLCNSMKAKDANIRQALIDKIGPQGVKKTPGPTYGISKDVWSALAIAVTVEKI